MVCIRDAVATCLASPLARWADRPPIELTSHAVAVVRDLVAALSPADYAIAGDIAIHRSAQVEPGAILKPPLVVGARCLVAAYAYLRGGCWLADGCIVGPGVELKSSFVFTGTVFAHFNFVGDSVVGAGVNMEAGAVICNHRNERADARVDRKFGALVGDGARIGANAVLAPGTFLRPGTVVARLASVDQEPSGGRTPD